MFQTTQIFGSRGASQFGSDAEVSHEIRQPILIPIKHATTILVHHSSSMFQQHAWRMCVPCVCFTCLVLNVTSHATCSQEGMNSINNYNKLCKYALIPLLLILSLDLRTIKKKLHFCIFNRITNYF